MVEDRSQTNPLGQSQMASTCISALASPTYVGYRTPIVTEVPSPLTRANSPGLLHSGTASERHTQQSITVQAHFRDTVSAAAEHLDKVSITGK